LLDEQPTHIRERIRRIDAGDAAAVDELRERVGAYVADPDLLVGADADPNDPDTRLRQVPAVGAALKAMFMESFRQGDEGWVEDWLATFDDWGFHLADVGARAAIWRGDADSLSPATDSDIPAADVPGAVLHVVGGEGHNLPVTHWGAILDSVGAGTAARSAS